MVAQDPLNYLHDKKQDNLLFFYIKKSNSKTAAIGVNIILKAGIDVN